MAYLKAAPKSPDWLNRAARDAAHAITYRCQHGRGDHIWHSPDCDKATDAIRSHMAAALALKRVKIEEAA